MALRSTLEQIRQDGTGSNTLSILFNAVQPILADLGWADRSQIDLERESDVIVLSASSPRGDRATARPLVFIKMDLSGAPSQRSIDRLRGVADRLGAAFLVVTNGQVWRLHLTQNTGDDTDSQFAVVNIRSEPVGDAEGTLTRYLAKEALVSGTAQHRAEEALITRRNYDRLLAAIPQVWRQLLAAPDSLLVDLVREEVRKTEDLEPTDEQIVSVIKRTVVPDVSPEPSDQTAGADATQPGPKPPRQRPTGYRLWGETYRVKYQRDILTGVAEAIYARHASTFERVTTLSSYFTKRPSERLLPIRIGSSEYYHEGAVNFKGVSNLVRKLLQAFGHEFSDIEILYDVPLSGMSTSPSRRGKRRKRRISQPPTSIRLWDETYSITRQYDVLTIVATQLYERHADVFDRALALAVITTDPTTRTGAMRIGQSEYYHEKALRRERLRRVCDRLLRLFGYGPSDLELIYE